jgi:hypothetical protein
MPERYRCIQFRNGCSTEIDDEIVSDDRLRIFCNDQPVTGHWENSGVKFLRDPTL